MDTQRSLIGPVNVKINSGPNGKNTFTAKIKDLNFEKLAMASGSKRNLLRFQKEAIFLDDAVLTYGPINKSMLFSYGRLLDGSRCKALTLRTF